MAKKEYTNGSKMGFCSHRVVSGSSAEDRDARSSLLGDSHYLRETGGVL